ncbi:MAG: GspH/FimT family pseudopilin, partial [Thermoguttaceae bacterium]
MNAPRPQRAAVTLIEVLLVVAIMAILAGLAIPNASPGMVEQLRSAANILAADLAYARSQAVTCGSDFQVSLSTAEGWYEIRHAGGDPALDAGIQNPFADRSASQGPYRVTLAELPSLGPLVRLAAAWTVDASGAPQENVGDVTFGPLGETVRSLGTRVWLSAGEGPSARTITIYVNSVTGLATVEAPAAYPLPSGM